MKLSTRARYALRMMVVLARQADRDQALSLSHISKTTVISRRYLEQLAIGLKRHGLIRGISGRRGGYTLAREPADITVGNVVEATIGPINIVECVRQPEECLKADLCECRSVYQAINDGIRTVLHGINLRDLAAVEGVRPPVDLIGIDDTGCPSREN